MDEIKARLGITDDSSWQRLIQRLKSRRSLRYTYILGMKVDKETKKQIICGYMGLCVLTVISITNYHLIRQQGENLEHTEHVMRARLKRHADEMKQRTGGADSIHGDNNEEAFVKRHELGFDSQQESNIDLAAQQQQQEAGEIALPPGYDVTDGKTPVKNVYYVKVHKAGSTTLQNIMFRFALKHNLRVAVFNRQWGMPYPDYARADFLYENISHPAFERYNMICDHAVYDRPSVASYMQEGYESIAILREPYSHLVSAFDFWGLAKRFRLHKTRDPLHEFLTNDPDQYRHIVPHFNRTKNMQAYHFGHIDYHDNSQESIDRLIAHVDKHFKLVMLRERFEESLILMRRLFKWDFEDILYMDQFVNTQPRVRVRTETQDEHLRSVHKRFAPVDYALYDHFAKKLDAMLQAEAGRDLSGEVLYFKETNRKIAEFCENVCSLFPFEQIKNLTVADILPKLQQGIVLPGNKWHKDIHLTYANCAYMKFWTYQYHNAFRVKQLPASCPATRDVGPGVAQPIFEQHFLESLGYCEDKNHILFNFPLDVFKEIVLDVPMHPVTNAKIAKAPKCKGRGEPSEPS